MSGSERTACLAPEGFVAELRHELGEIKVAQGLLFHNKHELTWIKLA